MKAFIVAALLVVAVAGQSLDMHKSFNKDLSMTSRKGLTYNQRYPYNYERDYDYSNMINYDGDYTVPSTHYYGGDDQEMINVLSYEEITAHPLFRMYYGLPLFRQYWSYPMFQRYVCSHYFQRYWQHQEFQQYFVEPTLFYKYIYPIVQLFKYDSTTKNTYTGGDWIWNKNTYPVGDYYYPQGQDYQQQQYNGYVPTVCYQNAMYCRALVQKMYNHLMYNKMVTPEVSNMDTDVYKYNPYYSRMMYPTVYNKQYYPSIYNKEMYPTVYNKEYYPTVYNKEMYPTEYNKEMYPTVYNKEYYPTIYNKEFQHHTIRPFFTNTINKAMIQDKTIGEERIVPEQIIKA